MWHKTASNDVAASQSPIFRACKPNAHLKIHSLDSSLFQRPLNEAAGYSNTSGKNHFQPCKSPTTLSLKLTRDFAGFDRGRISSSPVRRVWDRSAFSRRVRPGRSRQVNSTNCHQETDDGGAWNAASLGVNQMCRSLRHAPRTADCRQAFCVSRVGQCLVASGSAQHGVETSGI
jgi:hypothetical protein